MIPTPIKENRDQTSIPRIRLARIYIHSTFYILGSRNIAEANLLLKEVSAYMYIHHKFKMDWSH
jgi:hypothetical protein